MLYAKLGIRNLIKHKRKTLLTLLTISLGFSCLLLAKGYSNYCLWGLRESIINGGTGHYQIFKSGFKANTDDDSFSFLIQDYKKIIRDFSSLPGVKFVAPRLSFTGILSSEGQTTTVVGYGGWLDEEKGLTSFSTISKGSFPRTNEPYDILIGGGVAELSCLDISDEATLSVAMPSGAVNAMDFQVSGIILNQLEEMENTFALIPLETAQNVLDVQDSVDTFIIMLLDTDLMDSLSEDINTICSRHGLEWRRWDEIVPYYSGAAEFYSSAMNIALIVIVSIVIFSIINSMLMSVYERIREIGTMRSVGTTKGQIVRIIHAESVLLGFFGCLIGLGVAVVVAAIVNSLGGIPLPPPPGNTRAYKGLIFLEYSDALKFSLSFILVASLSSLFPAIKATRMSIADTLRWL
ncbi:MAG TPA: FtsX-like permease family protein [Treponemataceae bacterium]|nr:FtsX-like permease family protein [Treponemataceae bacterium]